ncbi:siderophore-interacting protein [Spongiactinospora sp. TRM90649]|uniref:siderophore-interacting protein n=1 Tax=Spongiactinospora sp. TRM90649 TaxID=3031114 RepID=UPI0023F86808|nr:siderophore-interacting protein [Spongiactinospora sp. TRM90649]MDF5758364.1 siderophore-interacting protein [Spongiactinospora sp. TRM90649]
MSGHADHADHAGHSHGPGPDRSDPGPKVAAHHRAGEGNVRVPYPIGARTVSVVARHELTPRMLRLTLGGPALDGLHTYQADDHVKIVFPDPDGTLRAPVPNDHQMLDWPRPMPTTRKYTIRRYDAAARELDLDFVLHDGGVASSWAAAATVGEEVTIAGPPGALAFPHTYDSYVFAVDATGLPAVARWLAEAPPAVSAQVVVECDDPVEHDYPLPDLPDGVCIVRLVRVGDRSALADTVAEVVAELDPLPGRSFLFAAGEATDIKPLRALRRTDALITGYWKRGVAGLVD